MDRAGTDFTKNENILFHNESGENDRNFDKKLKVSIKLGDF